MTLVQAIFLGIIEGLTEFLPVSSTAHLMIVSRWWGIIANDYLKSFEIAIQAGAMLAVIFFFFKKIIFEPMLFRNIIIGFIPAALVGFFVYPLVRWLLGYAEAALIVLFAGGVFIIFFEKFFKPKDCQLTPQRALLIGLCQCFSFIPGVSRSLATIVGGLAVGLSRQAAVEFSFLLAIPTIAAAVLLDVYRNISVFRSDNWGLLAIGFITAFISALASLRFFIGLVKRKNLMVFGWYRVAAAAIFWFLIFKL
jgi:undecaprenyl-diphosphatase